VVQSSSIFRRRLRRARATIPDFADQDGSVDDEFHRAMDFNWAARLGHCLAFLSARLAGLRVLFRKLLTLLPISDVSCELVKTSS
jgi:hypothetical protein